MKKESCNNAKNETKMKMRKIIDNTLHLKKINTGKENWDYARIWSNGMVLNSTSTHETFNKQE